MEELVSEEWIQISLGKSTIIDKTILTETRDVIGASIEKDGASLDIGIEWHGGERQSGKQTFTLEYPGHTIRCRWEITIHNSEHLVIWYNDYKGKVKDYKSDGIRTIIFEPDGVQEKLVIDPYLEVDEQATYIDVTCDGFLMRLYEGLNGSKIHTTDGVTSLCYLDTGFIITSAGEHSFDIDSNRTIELLENTPTRVVIRQVGNYYRAGPIVLANSKSLTWLWYIYSDRCTWKQIWVTETGSITISSRSYPVRLEYGANTNEDYIYEDGGSESSASTGVKTGDYIGLTSDEINFQLINLEHTEIDVTFEQYILSAAAGITSSYSIATTVGVGTHTITNMVIIDSAERAIRT